MRPELLRRPALRRSAALVFALFLAGYFVIQLGTIERNSDEASNLLAGYEMFHGNFWLSGWTLPPDSYWLLENVLFGFLTTLFGINPALLFVLPALIWTLVVLLAIQASRSGSTGGSAVGSIGRILLPVVFLVFLPLSYGDGLHFIGDAPDHVLTTAYSLCCILLASDYLTGGGKKARLLLANGVLSFLIASSDPFGVVTCFGPIILALLCQARSSEQRRPVVMLIGLTLCSFAAGRAISSLARHHGGFVLVAQDMNFCRLKDIPAHLVLYLKLTLMLFGADFLSKPLWGLRGAIPNLIRIPLLLLSILAVWGQIRTAATMARQRSLRADPDFIAMACACAVLLCISASIASTYLVNATSIRYLIPTLIFGAVLCGRAFGDRRRLIPLLLLQLVSAIAVATMLPPPPNESPSRPDSSRNLANWLSAHRLRDGYGDYWDASITTVLTHDTVRVRPIVRGGRCGLAPYAWLSNRRWYVEDPRTMDETAFIVLRPATSNFFGQDDVIRSFGKPDLVLSAGSAVIEVYSNGSTLRQCMAG